MRKRTRFDLVAVSTPFLTAMFAIACAVSVAAITVAIRDGAQ